MTFNEAEERAARLWHNVGTVARLRVTPELWEVTIEAVYQRSGRGGHVDASVHYLDANGHPTCHPACIAREAALGADAST